MSYKLQHTAEAIDDKLHLIDKNKNLLPYPYEVESPEAIFPTDLINVGDGSILTRDPVSSEAGRYLLLNICDTLTAGKKYTISASVTNILEEAVTDIAGFSLTAKVTVGGNSYNWKNFTTKILDLSTETEKAVVSLYLNIPSSFERGLVIKPQIEEGEEKTDWVPYMKTIGSYVDERFNGTNTKIKVLTESLSNFSPEVTTGMGIEAGEGTNSIVQSNANAQALTTNSISFGQDSLAGIKGYYYSSIISDEANNSMTLTLGGRRTLKTANTTLNTEPILSGKWQFKNDIAGFAPVDGPYTVYPVSFTCNGVEYRSMGAADYFLDTQMGMDHAEYINYHTTTDPMNDYSDSDVTVWSGRSWRSEVYKVIDFGSEEQEVDSEFYSWLTRYAAPIATEIEVEDIAIEYIVGDEISINSQAQTFYNCATITEVNTGYIKCTYHALDKYADISKADSEDISDTNFSVFCIAKPTIGVPITASSIAIGDSCKSVGNSSIALGRNAISTGSGTIALGRHCISTNNGSAAIGTGCGALANSGIALGNSSIVNEKCSIAAGFECTTNSAGSAAFGNNCITKRDRAEKTQIAVGQYNAESIHSIFVVGNGSGSLLYLDKDGNQTIESKDAEGNPNTPLMETVTDYSGNVVEQQAHARSNAIEVNIGGWSTFNSGITVKSNAVVDKVLQVGQDLLVGGGIQSTRDISTSGKITAEGNVTINGNITAGGTMTATGDIETSGKVITTGDIEAGGKITATGWSTLSNLTVSGNTVVSKLFEVGADATIKGTAWITGLQVVNNSTLRGLTNTGKAIFGQHCADADVNLKFAVGTGSETNKYTALAVTDKGTVKLGNKSFGTTALTETLAEGELFFVYEE